jgi:hypothetical protein
MGLTKGTTDNVIWKSTTFSSNDTVFVIGSYEFFVGAGNDTARLWINPDAATFGSSNAPPADLTATFGPDASQLASLVLFQKPAPALPAAHYLDELRIDRTWGGIVSLLFWRDFGDAPDSYHTMSSSDGPYHPVVEGVYLGDAVDCDFIGNPDTWADGDENDDGVRFSGPLVPGSSILVAVEVSTNGFLDAWIDFNRDGDFADGDEQVFSSESFAGTTARFLILSTPMTAKEGPTYARFRFSTGGHLSYDGPALDGEVEDYLIYITPCACGVSASAITDPLFTSWFHTNSGQYALVVTNDGGIPTNIWGTMTSEVYADVQKIDYSGDFVYVTASGLASYVMGPWYNDLVHKSLFTSPTGVQLLPYDQDLTARFPREPEPADFPRNTPLAEIGFYVNGSAIYNMLDSHAWTSAGVDDFVGEGEGTWHRDAWFAEYWTMDPGNFHQPESGQQHAHANPVALRYQLGDNVNMHSNTTSGKVSYSEKTNALHSPIIGWAFDGHPLYGPYGYSNAIDPTSAIRRMVSGYILRNPSDPGVSDRSTLPAWAQFTQDRKSTELSSSEYGPAIDYDPAEKPDWLTYELGRYIEDYEFLGDLPTRDTVLLQWDLDRYNGRCCVTPEFPDGTYAYFMTIDDEGEPVFPYTLGPKYCGAYNGGRVTDLTESVTRYYIAMHPIIFKGLVDINKYTIEWRSRPGASYSIHSSSDLQTWVPLTPTLPSGGSRSKYVIDAGSAPPKQQFYKVILEKDGTEPRKPNQ